MAEESKGASSSSSQSKEDKKPQQPATQPQPRPAPSPVAPPPPPSAPTPPQKPSAPRSQSRRTFAKAVLAVGAVLSLVPFVPWGTFLSSSVSSSGSYKRQKVIIDNLPKYGVAAGKPVNVNDLDTFPPNSHWVVTYPSSGNLAQDSNNVDTFSKYELVRLPAGSPFGGDVKKATAFVAFSKVCVHLWCSPNYNPTQSTNPSENGYKTGADKHEQYECPCHGSIYEIPDGLAKQGPASQQPAPTNAIPMLTLTADADGTLNIEPPVWDVDHNGVLGYGRNYQSYASYIKPAAGGA